MVNRKPSKADVQRDNLIKKASELQKRVFASDDGKELLEIWKHMHLVSFPSDYEGQDLFNLGKVEGKKSFVRGLVLFMQQASEGTR